MSTARGGNTFEEKIRKFRQLSRQFEALTKAELYARLSAKIPAFTQEAAQSSEIGILQKNLRNGGRATSLRKLFDSIPNLLPRLTPCMLMSPISVAQYFEVDTTRFDLVIFDEASQITPWDAIGAMARGKQVVIAGDPRQMPPSNDFARNTGTATLDDDTAPDQESTLDECLAAGVKSHSLDWHYRSRHESLIAFSNTRYYDSKLVTFPAPETRPSAVSWQKVPGVYTPGARTNLFKTRGVTGLTLYKARTEG